MPKYKVSTCTYPGSEPEKVEHADMDKLFEMMNDFKSKHPGCYMFKPFSDGIFGLIYKDSEGRIISLFVEEEDVF